MEVSLLEAEGLPQGCLLSVSSGGVRRQALATREKCRLAFPATATKGEGIRIEALEVVAGAKLPLQAGVEKYNLDLKGGKGYPARISLMVRDLALNSVGSDSADLVKGLHPPTPRGSGSRRHLAALSARRYLEDKGLLQWVQGLFQELVRERPEDPWPYVDRHSRELLELGGEEALDEEAPNSYPEEATAPEEWVPGARAPEEAPELEAPLPSANRAGTGQLESVTAATIEAAISGTPPHVLHERLLKLSPPSQSADEATTSSDAATKGELRMLLAKSCQDGSLHTALHTAMGIEPQAGALTPQAPRIPQEGQRPWRKAPGRVSPQVSVASLPKDGEGEASGSSHAAASRASCPASSSGFTGSDLEQLRQKARRRIEAASLSRPGSQHCLERSASQVQIDETQGAPKQDRSSRPLCSRTSTLSLPATQPSQAGKAEDADDAPPLSINELRAKAYSELTMAVQEQRLSPEALGFGPPSTGQLKERAFSELVAAAQDGSLDAEILELTAHQGQFATSSSGRRSIQVLQPPLIAEDQRTPRSGRKPLEAWAAASSLAEPRGKRPVEVDAPLPLAPSCEEEEDEDEDEHVLELRAGATASQQRRAAQDAQQPSAGEQTDSPNRKATVSVAPETLRLRARACLAQGAQAGTLGESLQAACAARASTLRSLGREALVASARAGTLREELEASPAREAEAVEVQRRLALHLVELARGGALAAALEDNCASTHDISEPPVMQEQAPVAAGNSPSEPVPAEAEQRAQNSCEPAETTGVLGPGPGESQGHNLVRRLVPSAQESSVGGPSTLDPTAEDQAGSAHSSSQASQSPSTPQMQPSHPNAPPAQPSAAPPPTTPPAPELPPSSLPGEEAQTAERAAGSDREVADEGALGRGAASPGDNSRGAEQENARAQERPALAVVGRRNLGPRSLRELASREVEDLRAKLVLAAPGGPAEAVGGPQQMGCGVEEARMLHSVTSAGEGSSMVI